MVVGTSVTQLFWNAFTLRDHLWQRRDFSGTLAAIRTVSGERAKPPQGTVSDNWGSATQGVLRTGPCVGLSIQATTDEQLDWLSRVNVQYLLSYPSNILALARQSISRGLKFPTLRQVRTFGELLEPQVRLACRQAWGVDVSDVYSSQEVGYIAPQCPETESYHIQAECVFVEVLDEEGRPCEPGQIGKIVVTTLQNFAMPLLRYDIGDYAEVGEACPCGRGLPVLRRIVGRQRNMAVLPDGSRRWPAIELRDDVALTEFPPIAQFQLIQRTLHAAELLLVTPRTLSGQEEQTVRGWAQQALGHPFDINIRYVREIPRAPTANLKTSVARCRRRNWRSLNIARSDDHERQRETRRGNFAARAGERRDSHATRVNATRAARDV